MDDEMILNAQNQQRESQTEKRAEGQELSFEERLEQLEKIVRALESGKLSLADSLVYFERGYALSRACSHELDQMEQRLKILLKTEEGPEEVDLDIPSGDLPFNLN